MFYLYDANKTEVACATNWIALRDHIYQNNLSQHFITNRRLGGKFTKIIYTSTI